MANRAAFIRAENPGLPVTRQGRHFLEFDLGGGKKQLVGTVEPLISKLGQEIDTDWVADTGAWQYKISSADYQGHARNIFNVGNLIEWRIGNEWVVFDPQSINFVNQDNSRQQISVKQAVAAQVQGPSLYFPNAYGSGRHFRYTAHPSRLIKHIIFDSLAALTVPEPWLTGTIWFEIEFSLSSSGVDFWLDGVKWAKTNNVRVQIANKIEVRSSATNEVLWLIDKPYAYDAAGERSGGLYEVRRQGGASSLFITVKIPYTWFQQATFPVTVDPTLTLQPDGTDGFDTLVRENAADTTYEDSTILYVLAGAGVRRHPLVVFDVSSVPAGATVDSATVSFWNNFTSGSNRNFWLHCLQSVNSGMAEACSWNYAVPSTTRWAGDAASNGGTDAGCSVNGTDVYSTQHDMTYIASSPVRTEHQVALTVSEAQGMLDDGFFGVRMQTDETSAREWYSSDEATYTTARPKLVLVYTEAASGTDLTVADLASGSQLDAVVVTQVHVLSTVGDLRSGSQLDAPAITKNSSISPADLRSGSSFDSPTLTQTHILTVADLRSGSSLDALLISQVHQLTGQDISLGSSLDSLVLTTLASLGVQDLSVAPQIDAVTLTQVHSLSVQDLSTAPRLDVVTFAGAETLFIDDLALGTALEVLSLSQNHVLVVSDIRASSSLDPISLSGATNLVVQDISVTILLGTLFSVTHPEGRTVLVDAESRVIVVDVDVRVASVDADPRLIEIGDES